ncbi:MAG TPA: hypothetical protein VHT92_07020 [Candidatus Cybelea sp.]|jgi:hypothetical protein|nr:hypothetical protein [Candidatus Cybelea sp.]
MKQTILEYRDLSASSAGLCSGKLIFSFAVYGCALWWLDRAAAGNALGQAFVWTVALLGGAALALAAWGA